MSTSLLRMEMLLRVAALFQLVIATLNLFLVPLLGWKKKLARVPQLMKEVFYVHAWFISFSLAIFGVMTWQFASYMAQGEAAVYRWLAVGIGLFWGLRASLQVTYYSSSHWRDQAGRTVVHIILLVMYSGCGALYLWAGFAER